MITGPLFKWFGSKWSSSRHYPEPTTDFIFEPFAGSAGYSLRHGKDRSVLLAESNERIFDLWRWLIEEATEASIREIPLDLPEGTDVRTIGLSYGQTLLLKNWQRTNNVSECWTTSVWGNKPGQWTENTRSRVASEFHHVKGWSLVRDGFDMMNKTSHSVTWFIDPPYKFNYTYGVKAFDYEALSGVVAKLRGQIIVCEAVCQKTDARPTWLPFVDFRRTVTSRRKADANHHSRELIYVRDS
jgi:site-specific DNA-adenine methylase